MFAAFEYFKTSLPGEWDVGEAEQGILTNNTGINALLRVFSDVLEYVIDETGMHPKQLEASSIVEMCKPMFSAIVDFYKSLSPELRDEIKHQYGGKGVTKHWRYFQYAIRKKYPGFNPPGLDQWWADNSKQYNEEAKDKLKKISDVVRNGYGISCRKKIGHSHMLLMSIYINVLKSSLLRKGAKQVLD